MVTVICYGKMEQWKSRKAAKAYYLAGIQECDNNSAKWNRYYRIHNQLSSGCTVCIDDDYTSEQLEQIQHRYNYVHSKEFDNYCVIPNTSVCEWHGDFYGFKLTDTNGNVWRLCKQYGNVSLSLIRDYRKVKGYTILFRFTGDDNIVLLQVTKDWYAKNDTHKMQNVRAQTSLDQFMQICQSAVSRLGALYIKETLKL